MQVTLALPDHIYRRAQRMAELSGRAVEEVLAASLDTTLPPLAEEMDTTPVDALSDEAVLEAAASRMKPALSSRFSELAQQRSAAGLSAAEQAEYQMLFELYEVGQQRKAQAMLEAKKRGLDWEAVIYTNDASLEG